jgi:hypothetical protein
MTPRFFLSSILISTLPCCAAPGLDGESSDLAADGRVPHAELASTPLAALGAPCLGKHEDRDRFGQAIAVGDFDGDGFDDVAVGTPGEDLITELDTGFVHVFKGSASGLAPWFGLSQAGLDDDHRTDQFGAALAAGDFDGDGHVDVVAGNLGHNTPFATSAASRFGVYANDFTGNRTTDVVLTQEIDGTEYPYFGLAKLVGAIYTIGLQFSTHEAFAGASVRQVFTASQLEQAVHYQADTFASLFLRNRGDGTFTAVPLPTFAQISPIRRMIAHDVDGDGHLDVIAAGNLYHMEPNTARADAGNGVWLRGDGRGAFTPVFPGSSGFWAPGEVTDLALLTLPTAKAVLVANNADALQAYVIGGR